MTPSDLESPTMTAGSRDRVLVAGIAGASLGTELVKSLQAADRYTIFGADISPLAYGHWIPGLEQTFTLPRDSYVEALLATCRDHGIRAVVPGGEGPLGLVMAAEAEFRAAGIAIAANDAQVVGACSDKARFFTRLAELGLPCPRTLVLEPGDQLPAHGVPYPCVVKPATGTGGSRFVFLAADEREAALYVSSLAVLGKTVLVQEYIPHTEGEYTIGVLSVPGTPEPIGAVAMQRLFHAKLSILFETEVGLISSGYSQGKIDAFPELTRQAIAIARALGSTGPFNVQARVRDGVLLPFEVNPRFSASTHLRCLAGFNEVDHYLRAVLHGEVLAAQPPVRAGYYLRSLTETVVPS